MVFTRRSFTAGTGLAVLSFGLGSAPLAAQTATGAAAEFAHALAQIEAASGGRLGVALLDNSAGAHGSSGTALDERFPMCSTFKVLAAGAVLARVDAGHAHTSAARIRFAAGDVVANSPITKASAGGDGMTLAELCAAAITVQRQHRGQPAAGQHRRPGRGDRASRARSATPVTRLDRTETDAQRGAAGRSARHDHARRHAGRTSTKLVLGDALSDGSREQLVAWLRANTTGGARLRAGVPADWRVGDKTGTGERGTTNDIARDLAAGTQAGAAHRLPDPDRRTGRTAQCHARRGGPRRFGRSAGIMMAGTPPGRP